MAKESSHDASLAQLELKMMDLRERSWFSSALQGVVQLNTGNVPDAFAIVNCLAGETHGEETLGSNITATREVAERLGRQLYEMSQTDPKLEFGRITLRHPSWRTSFIAPMINLYDMGLATRQLLFHKASAVRLNVVEHGKNVEDWEIEWSVHCIGADHEWIRCASIEVVKWTGSNCGEDRPHTVATVERIEPNISHLTAAAAKIIAIATDMEKAEISGDQALALKDARLFQCYSLAPLATWIFSWGGLGEVFDEIIHMSSSNRPGPEYDPPAVFLGGVAQAWTQRIPFPEEFALPIIRG